MVVDALDELGALVEMDVLEVEDELAEVDALEEVLGEVELLEEVFYYILFVRTVPTKRVNICSCCTTIYVPKDAYMLGITPINPL